ncbi:BRO family protein [Streptococcus pyogenes]|uniref:phage antirepressor KilAC domain-containing protein n=1 Tax=Streptococcus pyogenes TaxID=1314 RepID=UPI002246157E|nr:phage antirepressor KilAC domain-containing protein [Streptococcus pyogenes]MCX2508532.1 BRO family protein [Streptococcus pyogenes]HES9056642.1 phage antirepressor KilAC domain-containing protein [Streptococcus pyogenes]HES9063512.1 phage antirepressor KilAC domain-containing protein [Streptococcus pyogenes]
MSSLITFENMEFGKLTVMEKDGEFFFIGKEVAEKLGYSNTRDALVRHVDIDDKADVVFHDGRQRRSMVSINESGLYSLILSSKLPQAKDFKRWVTTEVLPSIRKNGGYIKNQENMSNEEILANAVLLANHLIAEKEKIIEDLEPKAKYFDELVDNNLLTNFRNTAKELHIPQKVFIQFLLEKELIYRDKKNRLLPYAKNNKGYFEVKEWCRNDNDAVGIQTFVTPKGRHFILLLIGGEKTRDR